MQEPGEKVYLEGDKFDLARLTLKTSAVECVKAFQSVSRWGTAENGKEVTHEEVLELAAAAGDALETIKEFEAALSYLECVYKL